MTCSCTADTLVCLRHFTSLCNCPPEKHTLRYRYTLDELPLMLQKLKLKAESFDHWVNKVKDALDPNTPKTMDLSELKALLHEADGKKFPKSDLLQTLKNAVEDAEKCASVVQQLDLNKIRTRTRNSADAKYKLTVEELVLFCEEIDSLACNLEEGKSVKELLNQTKKFEAESNRLLSVPLQECSTQELEKCLNHGNNLCIELPALKLIAQRLKQANWLKEVTNVRKKTEVLSMDALKNLISTGVQLPSDSVLEKELEVLQNLLTESEEWEARAQALMKQQGPNVLTEAEQLITESEEIEVYLPSEELISDALRRAKDWLKQLDEINSAEYYPYYSAMEDLIKKGKAIPFNMEEVGRLECYLQAASAWREKTTRTFLRKNCSLTLMEALSPRVSLLQASKQGKRKNQDEEPSLHSLNNSMDPATVVGIFKDAEDKEMEGIRQLRATNTAKSLDPNESNTFCICNKGLHGLMMQCELCKDWFHSTCVQLPKIATVKFKKNFTITALQMGFKDCKFLCINCYRTRRPRLETILSLLMSLQKLYIRVPEGEALQCLTERAMNWQDRARQLLQQTEIEAAVLSLSKLTQKCLEMTVNTTNDKIEKTNDTKKSCDLNHLDISPTSTDEDSQPEMEIDGRGTPEPLENCTGEHAYSLNIPKSECNEYQLSLSREIRQQLEDLLMEGDLLEVSLDETLHLWKLVQAARDPEKEITLVDFDVCILYF